MDEQMHRALAAALLLALAPWSAPGRAEIYSWVDTDGVATFSNLPPPDGVRVTGVIHEQPTSSKAASEAARQAEVSALNDRIRLLELQMARQAREAITYPAALPLPPAGCGPAGNIDCDAEWGPYYAVVAPYAYGMRYWRHNHLRPPGPRPPFATTAPTHVWSASGGSHGASSIR